jgi:cytoskeletal protein CcmA (bactofilin family)
METTDNTQNGKFTKMVKRIWNGPYEEEEGENVAEMKQERTGETDFNNYAGYPQREVSPRMAPPEYGTPRGSGYNGGAQTPPPYEGSGHASASENVTVISRGTTIVGDIKSDSDIEMLGTVSGNISTTGNVKINGKQVGDVQGSGVDLISCMVRGNLSASDTVSIDSESVLVGDIKCGSLTVDGKLKGNVHVMGNVDCQNNAVILGDISSTTISVSSGAKLCGKIEISDGSIEQIEIPDSGEAPKK